MRWIVLTGYYLHKDYIERGFPLEMHGRWAKGKGRNSFVPLGPYPATTDEIAEVNNLPSMHLFFCLHSTKYYGSFKNPIKYTGAKTF